MPWPKGKQWPLFLVKGTIATFLNVPAEVVVKARSQNEAEDRAFAVSQSDPARVVLAEAAVIAAINTGPFYPEHVMETWPKEENDAKDRS